MPNRYAFAVLSAASLVTTHWVAYKTGAKNATPNETPQSA